MKKITAIISLCFVTILVASAQRTVTGNVTYTYVMSDNETVREAEISAVRQAQLKMIADNFGTTVGATTTITMSNGNIRDFTFGETEVNGEWIKTIGTPVFERLCVDDHFIIKVTLKGEIREIVSNPVNYQFKILKNGSDGRFESTSFRQGDYLCLSFRTPEEGYLAVYLTDGETVQCLYPYPGLPSSAMRMNADTDYVLFSKEKSGELDPGRVQRMRLGCKEEMEHNRLYIVFSTEKFSKAMDHENGELPRQLNFKDFHSWLSGIRRRDVRMTVSPVDIVISKN